MCSDAFVMPSSWGRGTASVGWKPAGVLGLPEPLISARRLPAKRAILVPSVPAAYLPPSSHVSHLARTTHTHAGTLAIHLIFSWPSLILKMLLSKSLKRILKADSFLMMKDFFKSWRPERQGVLTSYLVIRRTWTVLAPRKPTLPSSYLCYHSDHPQVKGNGQQKRNRNKREPLFQWKHFSMGPVAQYLLSYLGWLSSWARA